MPVKMGNPLKPAELYRVSHQLTRGVDAYLQTLEDENVVPTDLGCLFRDNSGGLHVIHYPGKDNDNPITPDNTTTSLRVIRNGAQKKLKELANQELEGVTYSEEALLQAKQHYFVCEMEKGVRHFVYVCYEPQARRLLVEDSMRRDYPITYLINLFQGKDDSDPLKVTYQKNHYQKRRRLQDWQCGYHAALAFKRNFFNEERPKSEKITKETVKLLRGETTILVERMKSLSFFQRHRKTKYALIALGIGLGLFAVGVALAFAWPVVVPAVGGFITASIIAGLSTAAAGWIGIAALGVAVTGLSVGVSLIIKAIRDKVTGSRKNTGAPVQSRIQPPVSRDEGELSSYSPVSVPSDAIKDTKGIAAALPGTSADSLPLPKKSDELSEEAASSSQSKSKPSRPSSPSQSGHFAQSKERKDDEAPGESQSLTPSHRRKSSNSDESMS